MVVVVTSNMVVVVTSNMIVIVTSDIIFFVTLVVIAAVTSNVKIFRDVKYDDGVRGSFRDVRLSMDQSTTVQRAITV